MICSKAFKILLQIGQKASPPSYFYFVRVWHGQNSYNKGRPYERSSLGMDDQRNGYRKNRLPPGVFENLEYFTSKQFVCKEIKGHHFNKFFPRNSDG